MPQYAKLSFPFDFLARFTYLRRLPWQLALVLLLILLATLVRILTVAGGDWDKALVLLLLAAALMVNSCRFLPEDKTLLRYLTWRQRLPAWGLLLLAMLIFFRSLQGGVGIKYEMLSHFPLLLLLLAACAYWGGVQAIWIFFLPVAICALVLPNRELIALAISFPLRLLSTIISVEVLQLFGLDLTYHLTSIYLPGSEIAITDACSGIDQLEVLLFLGYLLVKSQHTSKRWSFIHYLLMLPAIILVNALRIVVTILLFVFMGEAAFDDVIHTLLGYALVLAVTILLWWTGRFFPDYTEAPEKIEPKQLQDADA